ncbi:MAG: hypothetical protein M3354_04490 [Chloroflexota bacterium]|nr:hypothetical protein [Chloroflexota bacterium]
MLDRREQELTLIQAKYGEIDVSPDLDWAIILRWELPSGWNKATTALLLQIPPGYPTTPPYGFGVEPDLRLAGGDEPTNAAGTLSIAERQWRQFSFSVEEWCPHANPTQGHNLLTFLAGVQGRLRELN